MKEEYNKYVTGFIATGSIVAALLLISITTSHIMPPTNTFLIGETFTYNNTRYCNVRITGSDFAIERIYVNCYKNTYERFYDIDDKELGTHHVLYDPRFDEP